MKETDRPWRFAIRRNTPNFTTILLSSSSRTCITITIIMTVIKVRPHLFAGLATTNSCSHGRETSEKDREIIRGDGATAQYLW